MDRLNELEGSLGLAKLNQKVLLLLLYTKNPYIHTHMMYDMPCFYKKEMNNSIGQVINYEAYALY